MSDLISRQAAIDLFPNDALEWDTNGGYIAPHFARRMIEDLPSAQPVRHGKWILEHEEPTVDAIPISWIKEWVEEIKEHPAYTEKEKTLCIEELEDMLGAWAEERNDIYVTLHHEDIHFIDEDAERAFYESLTERKEE